MGVDVGGINEVAARRHILIKETLQTRNNELMPLGPVVIDPPDAPASA